MPLPHVGFAHWTDRGTPDAIFRPACWAATPSCRTRGASREVLAELVNPYFETEPPEGTLEIVASAELMAGNIASDTGVPEAAVGVYDQLITRHGQVPGLEMRVIVAKALASKGATLGRAGRVDEAIEVYGNLLARLGDPAEPELRERVAEALTSRGYWYETNGRDHDALSDYRTVLERFDQAETSVIHEQRRHAQEGYDALSADTGRR